MAKAWIPNLSFRQQWQVPHDSQVCNSKSTSISEGCDHFLVIFKGLQRPCQHQTGWAYKLCKFRKNFMAFLMYLAEMNFNQENGSSSLTSAKDSRTSCSRMPSAITTQKDTATWQFIRLPGVLLWRSLQFDYVWLFLLIWFFFFHYFWKSLKREKLKQVIWKIHQRWNLSVGSRRACS